jgi:superfamily II DNA/RNA helicase
MAEPVENSAEAGVGGARGVEAKKEDGVVEFSSLELDPRLLRAVAKKGFGAPSLVQAECIPPALEGKDLVVQARTGSGKTMAYLLPALHRILTSGKGKAGWQALVLVPTRELCEQVPTSLPDLPDIHHQMSRLMPGSLHLHPFAQ